jgi:ABC-2 type transport system ATP-binding protein
MEPRETQVDSPIEARGLSKTYRLGFFVNKRVRALQNLDLVVQPGQVFGLLGPNGAGKSTTIKILMNLVQPSSGRASLFGLSATDHRSRLGVGFVPENPAPYEYLTGREFVTLAGRLCGLSGAELERRVEEVVGAVDMSSAAALQIRRYSKGMIQRIVLAQALVGRPKLLILDEPTSGLDPVGRRQIRDLILAERDRGTTILFCTHIIPDVEAVCDRVAVLVSGKVVREGSVRELLTGQVPLVELTVGGLDLARLRSLEIPLEGAHEREGRVLIKVADAQAQALVRRVLESGGSILALQPARFSLEDLFMNAIGDSARNRVGGEIC